MTDNTDINIAKEPDEPCPPTWGEMLRKLFWKIFTRPIEVDAGGGREVKMNVIVWLIVIASIVGALILLEHFGIVDDIKEMVVGRRHHTEARP